MSHDELIGLSSKLRWDDLRAFHALAEAGSVRAACDLLNCSSNTLSSRIKNLEKTTGRVLFRRSNIGSTLTQEGERLLDIVEEMNVLSLQAERAIEDTDQETGGEVKLAVTEGLGTFWLVPRIKELRQENPNLKINLRCEMRPPDLMRFESDIVIQLRRPEAPELKCRRLGFMHTMLFASPGYLRKHGVPKSQDDLPGHTLVEQIADQVQHHVKDEFLAGRVGPTTSIVTNTSSAHYWAVSNGQGMGMMPSYVRAVTKKVKPVGFGPTVKMEIWMAYHPDSKRIPRIRRTIDWLAKSFNPTVYPWFREELIHPNDLEEFFAVGAEHAGLFEGFRLYDFVESAD